MWAKPTDFADIMVSKRMFFDHIPTRSCPRFTETFKMLVKEAGEASPAVVEEIGGAGADALGVMDACSATMDEHS